MNRTFTVVDLDGEWVTNPQGYTFVDSSTGHAFIPGMAYKIKVSDWMQGQIDARVLARTEDLEKAASDQAAQEAKDQAAAAEQAEAERKAAEAAAAAEQAAARKAPSGKR